MPPSVGVAAFPLLVYFFCIFCLSFSIGVSVNLLRRPSCVLNWPVVHCTHNFLRVFVSTYASASVLSYLRICISRLLCLMGFPCVCSYSCFFVADFMPSLAWVVPQERSTSTTFPLIRHTRNGDVFRRSPLSSLERLCITGCCVHFAYYLLCYSVAFLICLGVLLPLHGFDVASISAADDILWGCCFTLTPHCLLALQFISVIVPHPGRPALLCVCSC